jgi:hypothetical protein
MTPPSPDSQPLDLFGYLSHHPVVAVALEIFCLAVSICLIGRMWRVHQRDSFAKKLFWTFVLFVPLLGWTFYASLFHPPGYTDSPAQPNRDAMSGGGSV